MPSAFVARTSYSVFSASPVIVALNPGIACPSPPSTLVARSRARPRKRQLVTEAADTVGVAGAPGASPSTSVTLTVIVWSAVFSRFARTTTT